MNQTIKNPLIFACGVAIGSVVTLLTIKGHYKAQKEEEVASLREVYDQQLSEINKEALEKAALAKNKPDISIYTQALQHAREKESDQNDGRQDEEEIEEEFDKLIPTLYEITPSEFASFSNDRTRVTITRFADDIFADEMYEEVDPLEYLTGNVVPLNDSTPVNCLDYIRRMSQDEICIRNFDLGLDIDICTDSRTYQDYMAT